MEKSITWEVVLAFVSIATVVGSFWWRLYSRIEKSEDELHSRINDVKDDLANYKVTVAQNFAADKTGNQASKTKSSP